MKLNFNDTKFLLEHVIWYKNAQYYKWSYHIDDLKIPSSPTGKLQMLQDEGYLKFQSSLSDSTEKDRYEINSIALTPKGKELLYRYKEQSFFGKFKRFISTIVVAILTSVTTVFVMQYLGLMK